MDPLTGLLLWLTLELGPNGAVLAPSLGAPSLGAPSLGTETSALPLERLAAGAPRLWVVFHDDDRPPMAVYAAAASGASAVPDLTVVQLAAGAGAERLLPGLDVPRLLLYSPYYGRGLGVPPASDLPLDVAEHYFRSLIEAELDHPQLAEAPVLDERAAVVMAEIPADQRAATYREALAAFGGHSLAVAAELQRLLGRWRRAGRDPCPAVDHAGTLFALWERLFTTETYRGHYAVPGETPRRWAPSPPLEPEDRSLFVQHFLGSAWSGDVRRDFDLDCPRP